MYEKKGKLLKTYYKTQQALKNIDGERRPGRNNKQTEANHKRREEDKV